MGKRLTCPRCGAENEYDVPLNEATASLREVRCRACGNRFSYGFAPEYVTEAEPEPGDLRAAEAPPDLAAEIVSARDRLARHVARYTEYHDRDRDLLLLYLLDAVDRLGGDLGSIRRALDVVVKRIATR